MSGGQRSLDFAPEQDPRVPIVVDDRVRISADTLSLLPAPVEDELRAAFTHENPKFEADQRMGVFGKEEPKIQTFRREHDGSLSFPRGGMARVRKVLSAHGLRWRVLDQRTEGEPLADDIPRHRVELRGYQKDALDALVAKENALLMASMGAGKTTIAFAIAAHLNLPTLVIVWEGKLFDQWITRCGSELGISGDEVGVIQGGARRLRPITIAMQQTLSQPGAIDAELRSFFGVVISDEVQRAGAAQLYACIDQFPARYRFGVSGDYTRADEKEFLIRDIFGDVAYEISRDELIADGHTMDVEVRVVPTEFAAPWYRGGKQFKRLLDELTSDGDRSQIVVDLVEGACENGERAIVFSHRVEHCFLLDSMITARGFRSGVAVGGSGRIKARGAEAIAGLRSGEVQVVVGTVGAIGQGIDVPSVSVGVATTPLTSNRQQFAQVLGRLCRKAEGKTSARLYYLWDRAVYGKKALRNLVKWNRSVLVYEDGRWHDAKGWLRSARKCT